MQTVLVFNTFILAMPQSPVAPLANIACTNAF